MRKGFLNSRPASGARPASAASSANDLDARRPTNGEPAPSPAAPAAAAVTPSHTAPAPAAAVSSSVNREGAGAKRDVDLWPAFGSASCAAIDEVVEGRDFILKLPDAILAPIFERLDAHSRTSLAATCKRLHRVHASACTAVHAAKAGAWAVAFSPGSRQGPEELSLVGDRYAEDVLTVQFGTHMDRGRVLHEEGRPPRPLAYGSRIRRLEVFESSEAHADAAASEQMSPDQLELGVRAGTAGLLLRGLADRGAPLRALCVEARPAGDAAALPAAIARFAPGLRTLVVGDAAVGADVASALFSASATEARSKGYPSLRGLALAAKCPPAPLLQGVLSRCTSLVRLALDVRAASDGKAAAEPLLNGPAAAALLEALPRLESLVLAAAAPADAEALSALLGGAAVVTGGGEPIYVQHQPTRGLRALALRWEGPRGNARPAKTPAPVTLIEGSPTIERLRLTWQRNEPANMRSLSDAQPPQSLAVRSCPRLQGLCLVVWTCRGRRAARPWCASTVMRRGGAVITDNPRAWLAGRRPRPPDRGAAGSPSPAPPGDGRDWDASDDFDDEWEETEDACEEDEWIESQYQKPAWPPMIPAPQLHLDISGCPLLRSFSAPDVPLIGSELKQFCPGIRTCRVNLQKTELDEDVFGPALRHLHIQMPEQRLKAATLAPFAALSNLETLTLLIKPDGSRDERLPLRLPACRSLRLSSGMDGLGLGGGGRRVVLEIDAPRLEELVFGPWGAGAGLDLRAPILREAGIFIAPSVLSDAWVETLLSRSPLLESLEIAGGANVPAPSSGIDGCSIRRLNIAAPRLRRLQLLNMSSLAGLALDAPLLREAGFRCLPQVAGALPSLLRSAPLLESVAFMDMPGPRELDLRGLSCLRHIQLMDVGLQTLIVDSRDLVKIRAYGCRHLKLSGLKLSPATPRWCAIHMGSMPGEFRFWDGTGLHDMRRAQ